MYRVPVTGPSLASLAEAAALSALVVGFLKNSVGGGIALAGSLRLLRGS